jgi:hypothetical protein
MSTNDAIDAEASGNSEKNIIFQMIKFKRFDIPLVFFLIVLWLIPFLNMIKS